MADERVVSDIVSKFLLNTCRLRPQISEYTIQAALWCATLRPVDEETECIPLITGSSAEFYIEPMLPLVGNIDMMSHRNADLAIPRGHPPPTRLPAEFHSYVKVYEIVDSHLPGYAYLELRYLLTEGSEDNVYSYSECDKGLFFLNVNKIADECDRPVDIHGPALLIDFSNTPFLSIDDVPCVRCLSWPPQAADWLTRHRIYDWPDSATVDRVVNNGCDLVGVAHRQCREDKWMRKSQHRLSFSRAEIVLINSWMPVQQIVYHMLRYFVKTERFANSAENTEAYVLSNYHIKTLMMWGCELKSTNFWTIGLNIVRICVELLITLSVWLTDARCQHYFINNCNLIDNSVDVQILASQLKSTDEASLSRWFVNNYIRKCFMLCPGNVSSLFSDITTIKKLQNAISAVIKWRLKTTLEDTLSEMELAECAIPRRVSDIFGTLRSYISWTTELAKTNSYLCVYVTAVAFLHVARKISGSVRFTDELMDILATIAGQSISTRRQPSQSSSEISLSKATKLMKVVANSLRSNRSNMQLIEIELSKAYLYRALRCKDSDSDSIYCLANVYLAVLYYTTGQYQTAIDHSTLVTRSQDHSQCSSRVVQGELLPKIDDDIDNVLGLAVFYQYLRTASLNQRQTQHVSVLTTELFAHYLNIRCLAVTQTSLNDEVCQLVNYLCSIQMSIADVLAVKSLSHSCHFQLILMHSRQQRTLSVAKTDLNTSELVGLLQRSAVEHLTTFRQLQAPDFGSVATIVTTDFEALYAYKHGDYQRCLQLSTQNVHTTYAAFGTFVPTSSEFIQLLDDDIASLTALTLIVNPKCRNDHATFCISQLTLSLYLMAQCQLKLRHSLTQTLGYIRVALREQDCTLNLLILKMTRRKVRTYLLNSLNQLRAEHKVQTHRLNQLLAKRKSLTHSWNNSPQNVH